MSSPSKAHPFREKRRLAISVRGMTPQAAAAVMERNAPLPCGDGDRFSGYSVLGVPFATGDVLVLRKFTRSSLGPHYTSVWHRSPAGQWVFYSNVAPDQSCARYFGRAIDRTVVAPVRLEWVTPFRVQVLVPSRLEWEIDIALSPAARLINAVAHVLPEPWWRSARVLRALAVMGRLALGTGPIAWTGCTPNGHAFTTWVRRTWVVESSRARVGGRELGAPHALPRQARLADVRIPQRGLFVVEQSRMDAPAAAALRRRALPNAKGRGCVLAIPRGD